MAIKPHKKENIRVDFEEIPKKRRGRPSQSEKTGISSEKKKATIKTRKKRIAKPTKKQKEVMKILEETTKYKGGKKTSKKEILATAGYSKSSQKTPQKIFGTASMQKLFEVSGFSVETLKQIHAPLFGASSVFRVDVSSRDDHDEVLEAYSQTMPELEYITTTRDVWGNISLHFRKPDNFTILRALEIGYKILGAFAPEKIAITDKDGNDAPISSVSINIIQNDQNAQHPGE